MRLVTCTSRAAQPDAETRGILQIDKAIAFDDHAALLAKQKQRQK